MSQLETKWWIGIGPQSNLTNVIDIFMNNDWEIQNINNIGKYKNMENAVMITTRIDHKDDEKVICPTPGNDFEPVFEAEG